MTDTQEPDQIIAQVVGHARAAVGELPFEKRAALLAEVIWTVREGVKVDLTSGPAPDGKQWELDNLRNVLNVAQGYADEAEAIAFHRRSL